MKNKLLKTLCATTIIIFGLSLQAAEDGKSVLTKPRPVQEKSEFKPHVGLFIGAAQPEGSGVTASEFGLDVGYQPFIPYGLAVEFNHSRIDDGSETKNRDTLWAKGTYNFAGDIPVIKDSYAGVGLGSVFKSDGTSVAIAPIVGFDIPVDLGNQNMISLGASSRYAIVSDGEVDTFSLAGAVKYWY